ncbi:MAG: c-type cytochrome domain-containing protein [Myxococcota bacterium]
MRGGIPVGSECTTAQGKEIGCKADEICRLGFCGSGSPVTPGDGGPGADAATTDHDGGSSSGCGTGTATNAVPLFGGLTSASADGPDAVLLSWNAAADETLPAAIRYRVYVSTQAGQEDFNAPSQTVVGATSARVTNLSADTAYYFVVRAEDESGQLECNTTEKTATPHALGSCISYNADVKPILDGNCISCHSGATPPRNLHLDSYSGVLAGGLTGTEVVKCQPTASLIYLKVSSDNPPVGVRMPQGGPYLGSGQIATIERWIAGGAPTDCPMTTDICSDAQAPTFAGLTRAALNTTGAELCWDPASDDVTAAADIVYDVYQGTAAGAEAFSSPPLTTTAPGATCKTVEGLTPGQEYCWVVRARDAAGNRDLNTVERCLTTQAASCIDYATVIQPIFNAECVQCHAGANPPRNLHLDSYAGVIAGGLTGNEVVSCQPNSSLLYQKISMTTPPVGARMPADGPPYLTTSQIGAIQQWIAEGGRRSCAEADPCSDAVAPTFAGLTTATAVNATTVELCWGAGSDNLTPASSLLYDAYLALSPGGEDFVASPYKTSAAGQTCVQVNALSPGTQHCWVVRARDGAGNRDQNTVERCVTTPALPPGCVDYASMIQPLLDRFCTRCHAGDRPPQWLRLDSYAHVIEGSVRRNEVVACDPSASLIVSKIGPTPSVGRRMPFDGPPFLSAAQIAMVTQWVSEGAQHSCGEPRACGDRTAPAFAGATSASATDSTTVRVCWGQATDAVTSTSALRYDVYQGASRGAENFSQPPQSSVVGALCTDVRAGPGSTTCFVVRARDLAGNQDRNGVEVCATTPAAACAVDYDTLVQPILSARCTHCHRGDSGPRFLDLRSYGSVLAGGVLRNEAKACDWAHSMLNTKTAASQCGRRMPFDGPPWLAPSERSLLEAWVSSGARRDCAAPAVCGDAAAPTFAGITRATPVSPTSVEVCWNPASDPQTQSDSIVYQIFDGPAATNIDYNRPAPYAAAGTNCATIPVPTAEETCFSVRARDLAGNADHNTVTQCATPGGACFAYDNTIQPVFNARCIHCHSGPQAPEGIRWDTYQHAVGNSGAVRACRSDDSKLVRVTSGCEMPQDTSSGSCRACLSSAQTRLLRQWVDGGALADCPWGGCP